MKSVMFSINRPHTDNIRKGIKTSELRTRPPKIDEPYKAYIYETLKGGGCGKVIGEFIANNKNTYHIYMGIPAHLVICGCVSAEEILRYTKNGEKDLTEISISDLIIYDKPRKLSEFRKPCTSTYMPNECKFCKSCNPHYAGTEFAELYCQDKKRNITKPFQSWGYVEECN